MSIPLYCGQALCKAPVSLAKPKWPLRCERCGAALYPHDILERLPPSELEPERAELMTERNGVRVGIASTNLATASTAPSGTADDAVDRILAMVELDPKGAAARRKGRIVALAAAMFAIAVAIAIVFVSRR